MPGPIDKPPAELEVTVALVRELLAQQHPDLSDLPIEPLASGWDNALLRVGDDLIARMPRRQMGAGLVESEVRWLAELAPHLPLPIPVPVRVGEPGASYPWRWTLVPHFAGRSALYEPPTDLDEAAEALGGFVRALHRPAPVDAPINPYRGVPLADRDERTRLWIDALRSVIDADAVTACWEAHLATPGWTGEDVWIHGDLHPNNLIVDRGRLSAVIDFGDITSGDPATDLVPGWMLFAPGPRERFRDAVGVDDDTWRRARGWALSLSLAYLFHSADEPGYGRIGRRSIEAVLADRR